MDGGISLLTQEENLTVVKSNKLIEAIYEDFLTIREQKLILKVCSLIKRDDEEFTTYTIGVKDFSEMMELKGYPKYSDYIKITEKLLSKVISIKEENGLLQTHWFSKVRYNFGEGTIAFSFPYDLKPHLLKLKENFTPLELKYILKLNSSYSIRFYELMRSLSFRHNVLIDLKDLKSMLGIKGQYKEYSNFKLRILNSAKDEINKKTDITFEYEEIKKARKVVAIRFFIKLRRKKTKDIKHLNNFETKLIFLLEEHDHLLTIDVLNKWIQNSREIFGEDQLESELESLVVEGLNKPNINNPIGFITYILEEKKKLKNAGKDHNNLHLSNSRKRELIPEWLEIESSVEQVATAKEEKNNEEGLSIAEQRDILIKELAEMNKALKERGTIKRN